jgi:5-methyltetrahydrofolate--homocysteine methyltransferase
LEAYVKIYISLELLSWWREIKSMDLHEKIANTIVNLEDSNKLGTLIKEALEKKISPNEIIEKGLRKGLEKVGQKFEMGEYFLSELLFAASMVEDAIRVLMPLLSARSTENKGTIILGTVRGDIHDIGKNIFKMLMEANGFKVYDLGVDVRPEDFVDKVKEVKPDIVGLSALLTTTLPEMKVVIEELKRAGVREKVKVLLGGNAVTEEFGKKIGADKVAKDAVQGVNFCKEWIAK